MPDRPFESMSGEKTCCEKCVFGSGEHREDCPRRAFSIRESRTSETIEEASEDPQNPGKRYQGFDYFKAGLK